MTIPPQHLVVHSNIRIPSPAGKFTNVGMDH